MATHTKNYKLTKPGVDDPVDVSVLNDNFDAIDEKIKEAADAIPAVATQEAAGIVKPDGITTTVDPDGTIHGAQTYVLPQASATVLGGIKVGENLTIGDNGKLNAYANIEKDQFPTEDSENVPTSGGTYSMISLLTSQVDNLDSQVAALTTGIQWQEAVNTYDDIATTYPAPSKGWTVMCIDTGKAYQWSGTAWIFAFASLVPVASVSDVRAVLALSSN